MSLLLSTLRPESEPTWADQKPTAYWQSYAAFARRHAIYRYCHRHPNDRLVKAARALVAAVCRPQGKERE